MRTRRARSLTAVALLVTGAVLLGQQFTTAEKPEPAPAADPARATTESLGGAERLLTYLATDKPVYRVDETVYLRGVVLGANDRKPLPEANQVSATIEIIGPKGETVASTNTASQESVLAFAWKVPEGQAGGEYTAKVTYSWVGHPPAERKFDVRVYRAPRLKSQIEFLRKGYGPSDTVAASIHVERAEGGIPENAKVDVIARVDGAVVYEGNTTVDPAGNAFTRFELPAEIARGEGTLAFIVADGGVVETASKTIPILLQTVDLQMYPEGGEIVVGLPNRVYVEARTPAQKPADIAGAVVNAAGESVAEFRTTHEGRGRFEFQPRADETYELRITQPAGINTRYPLPVTKSTGVVLRPVGDVVPAAGPVNLQLGSATPGTFTVTVNQREVELANQTVRVAANRAGQLVELSAKIPAEVQGVLRVTVWDAKDQPVAERLVFRQPQQGVHIAITADRERYVPGGKVALTVKTTDEAGEPIAAVVGLTVTDDSVLEMIDKREQAPRLPVMVLLEKDVRDLADAHVYLDPSNPDAETAVDLLLGTQGWRRFAFVDVPKFVAEHGDDARRVLALRMPARREQLKAQLAFNVQEAAPDEAAFDDAPQPPAAPGADPGAPQAEPAAAPRGGEPQDAAPLRPAAPPVAEQELKRDEKAGEKQIAGARPAPVGDRAIANALEQAGQAAEADAIFAADEEFAKRLPSTFVYVREFAHAVRENRQPGQRSDFTETLYWNAGLKTDAKTGKATVTFDLSDAITSFRTTADAFDGRGALGTGTSLVESVEPLYAEPKLPLQLTSGDVVQLPLAVVNSTLDPLSDPRLTLTAEGLTITDAAPFPTALAADTRVRRIAGLDTTGFHGSTDVVLALSAGGFSDRVTRSLDVRPLGFPVEIGAGGILAANDTIERKIIVPGNIVPGSITTNVRVFPSPLSNMTAALERLIQEPNGCFEQTSSSTYPLVMAQQYFQSHSGIDPQLVARSEEMLAKGYARLIGYECKQGGFEWFGEDPGHEALTAYGLLEFSDMAQVREVDQTMIDRSRKWLLSRRDGQGGYTRERRALHTWLADPEVSNAYITWALLAAGESAKDFAAEIDTVGKQAESTKNSYVVALAANVMLAADRQAAARKLIDRLIQLQDRDGSIPGATTSIVGSSGESLTVETTALATLAFTNEIDDIDFADKGVRYLTDVCKGGRYGSTQSTVLALKAIVAFDAKLARPKAAGSVQLVLDGQPIGKPVAFDRNTEGAIELPSLADRLTPGEHTLALTMADGSNMPFAFAAELYSTKPVSSDDCKVELAVSLVDDTIAEGAVTEARVTVTNRTDETVPTPIAIVGLPGGLEVRHDQLKELVESGKIAAYEVLGREVVLYWRGMEAGAKVELPLSVVAAVPGSYTGPASRAYLYYGDEHKQWRDPLHVTITPRAE